MLELLLRLGGFIFTATQQWRNDLELKSAHSIRILSLGDSFTTTGGRDAYPRQLERILNKADTAKNFSVFVEGLPSTSILYFVANLESYIKKYNPHIVTLMIGILDRSDAQILPTQLKPSSTIPSLRLGKLAQSLARDIKNHFSTTSKTPPLLEYPEAQLDNYLKNLEEKLEYFPNADRYYEISKAYSSTNRKEIAYNFLKKALTIDPHHYKSWGRLGRHYTKLKAHTKAADAYETSLKYCPLSNKDYRLSLFDRLGDTHVALKNYPLASTYYQKGIDLFPAHPTAYEKLGQLLRNSQHCREAEQFLIKQIHVNPMAFESYGHLAYCFEQNNKIADAKKLLTKSIKTFPNTAQLPYALANHYLRQHQWTEAKKMYHYVLTTFPPEQRASITNNIYVQLLNIARAFQNTQEIASLEKEISTLRSAKLTDYQFIKNYLQERGIQFIVIQYPLRSTEPLKELYNPSDGIIFVENKNLFEKGIAQEGLETYFVDMHVGEFGHCTAKGNRLIANNLAETILIHIQNKQLMNDDKN